MRLTHRRWIVGLAVLAAAGILNQAACIGFGGDQLLRTLDMCFLFDCQDGALGGLLNPCPDVAGEAGLFVDCIAGEDN